jgi:hypothetical protein
MPSDADVEDICERIRCLQAATAGGAPGLTVAVRSAVYKRDVEISRLEKCEANLRGIIENQGAELDENAADYNKSRLEMWNQTKADVATIAALRSRLGRATEALRVISQAPAYEAWARELCAQDPSIPMKLTMRVDEFIPLLDLLRELAGGEGGT